MKKGMLSALALAAVATGLLVGVGSSSSAGDARLQALRRLRALAEGEAGPRLPGRSSKKGAFFKSLKGDVKYTVCVKFPKAEHLCTEKPQEAEQGTLYVNKITSTSVGKPPGHLVRQRQESRHLRLSREIGPPRRASSPGRRRLRHRDRRHRRLRLARRRGPRRGAARALRARPAAPRDRPARRGRALRRRGGRLGRRRPDRGRARARLVHRPAGRDRHRQRAGGEPRHAGAAASRTLDALGAGIAAAGADRRAPRRPRRLPRRGLRRPLRRRRRAPLGARGDAPGGARGAARPGVRRRRRSAVPGRYDFVTSWKEQAGSGSRTTPIPSTGSPRATSAPWRRRGRAPNRSNRSTSDLQTRSVGVSEILSREQTDGPTQGRRSDRCAGSPTATCRP